MSEIATDAKTIYELDHETFMRMVRTYSKHIGLLASRGDPLSATVKTLYEHLFDHQTDPKAHHAFRSAFRDWMMQHLEISSRVHLASKFGYLVEGEDPSGPPKTLTLQ